MDPESFLGVIGAFLLVAFVLWANDLPDDRNDWRRK